MSRFKAIFPSPSVTKIIDEMHVQLMAAFGFDDRSEFTEVTEVNPWVHIAVDEGVDEKEDSVYPYIEEVTPAGVIVPVPTYGVVLTLSVGAPATVSALVTVFFVTGETLSDTLG